MKPKPVVSVIGSCRVHNPMKQIRNASLIQLNNSRLAEFCHTPREALQKIRVANNRLAIPAELSLLINGIAPPEEAVATGSEKRSDFRKTDVFLIEISSVRRLTLAGMELQINFVTDFLVKRYGLEDWFGHLCKKARNVPQGMKVRHAPSNNLLTPEHIIAQAAAIEMSMEPDIAIADMVRRIVDYLGKPIVFSGHFDVIKDDGKRVDDRVRLNQCLKEAATQYGAGYFEPATLIDKAGRDVALRDNNHWAITFEKDAGKYILDNHILPVLQRA